MKLFLIYINKYLFLITLIISGMVTYEKMNFLTPNSTLSKVYMVILVMIVFATIFLENKAWYIYPKKIISWGHILLHGIVLLTFPMGIVFALTGSYFLALKVLLFFYLPSGIAFLLNMYLIKTI